MESCGEWKVTVYYIIFGGLTATIQIVKLLRFVNLAANSTFPIFSVAKLERVSCNFTYTERFYKFTTCFTECLLFLC